MPGELSFPNCLFPFNSAVINTFKSIPHVAFSLAVSEQPAYGQKVPSLTAIGPTWKCWGDVGEIEIDNFNLWREICLSRGSGSRWESKIYREEWILCYLYSYVIFLGGPSEGKVLSPVAFFLEFFPLPQVHDLLLSSSSGSLSPHPNSLTFSDKDNL